MNDAPTFTLATANAPGAIGLVQLHGDGSADIVERLTGRRPTDRCALARFEEIDEGLIVALRDDWCQLMPHGGLRVMQRLSERLIELGATPSEQLDAQQVYPEASTPLEADMLLTLGRAASPVAVGLLLAQPALWRARPHELPVRRILARSERLDRLVEPPTVAVVGRANVGKSTLTNLVMGRTASIVADLPGTTRDWVGGLAKINAPIGEVVVRWFDTPGLRTSDDPIERRAIELARRAIDRADVLIALRDPIRDWPEAQRLPRRPDLHVLNKIDTSPAMAESRGGDTGAAGAVLRLSALHGEGLDELCGAIAGVLGLADGSADVLWAFSPALRRLVAGGGAEAWARYVG